MPVKVVGPERMLSWKAKGESARNKLGASREPEYGLGPQGMVGSVGYNQNSLSPQAQKWERMGLYWTGRGVAQGRPLAEIESDIGLAGRRDARDERRFGQDVINQDRSFGLADQGQAFTHALSIDKMDLDKAEFNNRKVLGERQAGVAEGHLDVSRLNAVSGLASESQPEGTSMIGLAAPRSPLVSALTPKQQVNPIPSYLDNKTAEAIAQGVAIDPSSRYAKGQYEAIGEQLGLKGNDVAGQTKALVDQHRAAFTADQARRMPAAAATPAAAGADVDPAHVEAIFARFNGSRTREEIIAALRAKASKK
jgi:hypothetical protein